jgi:hypothetical protein
MSKALAVLLELKDCSDYWSEYFVPIGIHERIDEAIQQLLAQPEQQVKSNRVFYQEGYAQAELDLKREPLSKDGILELWANKPLMDLFECTRLVEKAHGIGGEE